MEPLIDVSKALGYAFPQITTRHDARDVALYALGVGAGKDPCDEAELPYVFERWDGGIRVLPTFGVVPAVNALLQLAYSGTQAPGLRYGFERTLHGEQYVEIKRPIPTSGELTHHARIKHIFDKGKNALVVTEIKSFDERGDEVVHNEVTTFVRGAGGFGGDRGPSADAQAVPGRAPDAAIDEAIAPNQALLYRLSGDFNPLHADPRFAKSFGFHQPILHGLCTFGIMGRHVLKAFCEGDVRRVKSARVRFADSVFPGETLRTEMWREDGRILVQCRVLERDKVALSNAVVELT